MADVSEMIKSLILDEEAIKNASAAPAKPRSRTEIEYETEVSNGATCVVARYTVKNPDKKTRLVLIGEKSQYYIKRPDGTIEALTEENLAQFLKNVSGDGLSTDNAVFDYLPKGKNGAESVMEVLRNTNFTEAAKAGIVSLSTFCRDRYGIRRDDSPWFNLPATTKWYLAKAEEVTGMTRKDLLARAFRTNYGRNNEPSADGFTFPLNFNDIASYSYLEDIFGLNPVRNAFEKMLNENVYDQLPDTSTFGKLFTANGNGYYFDYGRVSKNRAYGRSYTPELPTMKFESTRFFEYLLSKSLEEGYPDTLGSFVDMWGDTLVMQNMLYGKIIEKYPENLTLLHNQLSYRMRMKKNEIDARLWEEAVAKASEYEYTGGKWSLVAPKTTDDIYKEAANMSNCVASYIPKMIRKESLILFLRETKNVEESVCTVEISPLTGHVVQFKAKFNREPTPEQKNALSVIMRRIKAKQAAA